MSDSARGIMFDFVARTRLGQSGSLSTRYLWTDAFAVYNLLGLHLEDRDPESLRLALQLVDETHRVLGRHRPDDARTGWISGLEEAEGSRHPTIGGLRIGKTMPERSAHESFDPALEWDRDGQYFHYLTKWMVALSRVSDVTDESMYRCWAAELARTAYERFVVRGAQGRPIGMHWKMSIDLARPLVPSMGQHDPLDGFLVFSALRAVSARDEPVELSSQIRGLSQICVGRDWRTDDALGIGGLMSDAYALAQMIADGVLEEPDLLRSVLDASRTGFDLIVHRRFLDEPVRGRLPFRELGLSIGLHAIERLKRRLDRDPGVLVSVPGIFAAVDSLVAHLGIASKIEQFWLDPSNRRTPNWTDHLDINEVMLATSLLPRAFLEG
jgi:hypothetical protein